MSTALSAATGIASSIGQGITSWQAGKAQAHLANREANYKTVKSAEEVRQMEDELLQLKGTQATRYGASGVKMEGSPADVMLATERSGRHDIEFKKMMDAAQIRETRKAGKVAQRAGESTAIGSFFSGLGNFVKSDTGKNILSGKWSLLGK